MRLTSSRAYTRAQPVPRMPPGLVELMDGLARDVLMHNPTNVYEFCASHMAKLLEIRDGPKPSTSKKTLTLEEKILIAQEKMRQKAQERRERFDKEIKIQSDHAAIDYDKTDTALVSKDPVVPGPSHRAPIHHDLKNTSEVEISHVLGEEQAPLCEHTDSSKIVETNSIKEGSRNVLVDNSIRAENQNTDIICDDQIKQELESKLSKKLDDEPIFGKVEKETINVDPLKEPQLENVNLLTIESPLQTITESSEENLVNYSAVILPRITIGDDGQDPDNIFGDSRQEIELVIIKELNNKEKFSTEKSSEIQTKSENSTSKDVADGNDTKNETIVPESTLEPGKITPDFITNNENDYADSTKANEKQIDDSDDISEITQTSNSPAVADTAEANPNDGNIKQYVSSKVSTDETHSTANTNLVIPLAHVPNVKHSHDEDSVNDPAHKDTTEDKEMAANDGIEKSNVSEKEAAHDSKENDVNLKEETGIEHVKTTTENESNLKVEPEVEHVKKSTEPESYLKIEPEVEHVKLTTEDESNLKVEPEVKHVKMTTENEYNLKVEPEVEHVKMTTENESNLKVEPEVKHVKMTTENESNLKVEPEVEHVKMTTENESNLKVEPEVEHVKMAIENESSLKVESEVEHVTSTENQSNLKMETDVEHASMSEIHNVDSNKHIDGHEFEPEIIQHSLKTYEDNLGNDYEKHTDSTDISLQKSDSIENTNEDSMSMVESDLSKTDDDSTQNNPNMDLETAAVTIQKVFRSFMFKSRNSTFEDTTNDEHNSVDEDNDKKEEYFAHAAANLNKERRPLGITRMDTVLQTVNEEKSLSLSTDDSSTLSSAATTIQAHVRGFLVRNRLNSSKTFSMNSLVSSHEALEADPEQHKNKTILNIHIVPEEGNYLSRDESLIMSMDLSLDGSPPSSVNLHPLSCDISERRKMLKREDAVQSVTPPSNNSGKLSEDSVKEVLIDENGVLDGDPTADKTIVTDYPAKELDNEASDVMSSASTVTPITVITISKSEDPVRSPREDTNAGLRRNGRSLTKLGTDESDVITPFVPSPRSSEISTRLEHSGEFHDVVLPTKVSRSDTSAVRGE